MKRDALQTYNKIGKILTGVAGGIVGFVLFGNLAAVLVGALLGLSSGYLLEKVLTPSKKCC